MAERHQQDGEDEDEEGKVEGEEDEEVDVEVEVLSAASGHCPHFSAGTLQRGIPIPLCCL